MAPFDSATASIVFVKLSETVAASAGSACHSGEAQMSSVLQAMGVDEPTGFGTLRLSVGRSENVSRLNRQKEVGIIARSSSKVACDVRTCDAVWCRAGNVRVRAIVLTTRLT